MRFNLFLIAIIFYIFLQQSFAIAENKVTIELVGNIVPECRVTFQKQLVYLPGALNAKGQTQMPVSLFCNAPFEFSMTSRFGSLQREGFVLQKSLFRQTLAYTVGLNVPTTVGDIRLHCASEDMIESGRCPPVYSGGGISTGADAALSIEWDPTGQRLESGQYSDELTVTVNAKL